jgi:hypothetical protein
MLNRDHFSRSAPDGGRGLDFLTLPSVATAIFIHISTPPSDPPAWPAGPISRAAMYAKNWIVPRWGNMQLDQIPLYANHHLARIPNAGYLSEGRYTSPFLITISTRRMSLICLVGSPFTRIMPAYLPSAIEPRSWSMCKPVVRYKGFLYQAATWKTARRVVPKVEHHAGELSPRVGFIVTNLNLPSRAVVRFYNKRGTAEQWIKEGKQAAHWMRLYCLRFRANEVRLQLSVLAYNLGNLWRRLVLPNNY